KLVKFTHLQELKVPGTKVTDDGLKAMPAWKELAELDLDNCKITDRGIACLSKFPKLAKLHLGRCDVSATGFKTLSKIRTLTWLHAFTKNPVAAADVKDLQCLPTLYYVALNARPEDQAAIKKVLPKAAQVEFNPGLKIPVELFEP